MENETFKHALEINIATLLSLHPDPLTFLAVLNAQIQLQTIAKLTSQIENMKCHINGITHNYILPMNKCLAEHANRLKELETRKK